MGVSKAIGDEKLRVDDLSEEGGEADRADLSLTCAIHHFV
jgi:hypothetical protein